LGRLGKWGCAENFGECAEVASYSAHQQSCLHAAMGVSTSTSGLWSKLPGFISYWERKLKD
jgi:hypothetical protein